MSVNPPSNRDRQSRRSLRLPGFDYGQAGAYFVTICTHNRVPMFGSIVGAEMRLNEAGRVVRECWTAIPEHYPRARTDAFVVMPNHVHGIVLLLDNVSGIRATQGKRVGANDYSPLHRNESPFHSPSRTLGAIVRGFKIGVTKWFRNNTDVHTVWQRNYYEHVIRSEAALNDIREYIINNPAKWADDPDNPKHAAARYGRL